jgi:hypothetical protein
MRVLTKHGGLLFLLHLSGTVGQCSNTCNYASDGDCDDGGPGSEFSGSCSLGTDCADCGTRSTSHSHCPVTHTHTPTSCTDYIYSGLVQTGGGCLTCSYCTSNPSACCWLGSNARTLCPVRAVYVPHRTATIRTIRTIRIIRTRRTATARTATRLAQRDKPALTRVSSPLTMSATTAAPEARVFLSGALSEPTALTADLGRHLGTATVLCHTYTFL